MSALQIIMNICLIITSLVLIVSVLMQESESSDGMGALSGSNDSYFGKSKNAALQAKLALITKISAGVFVALSIAMMLIG